MQWKRLAGVTVVGAVLVMAGLANSGGAQTPPLPPGFTLPTFPPIPTTVPLTNPPPTMPPPTTTTTGPPPTMPPSSSPPTIPPTITDRFDEQIEGIIDRLEEFGDQFADIVNELRDLQNEF